MKQNRCMCVARVQR